MESKRNFHLQGSFEPHVIAPCGDNGSAESEGPEKQAPCSDTEPDQGGNGNGSDNTNVVDKIAQYLVFGPRLGYVVR